MFDATNTFKNAGTCNGTSCGFVLSGGTAGSSSQNTLEFRFANFGTGRKFEWNSDTDGGVGINGAAMAGMTITVTFSASTTVSGVMAATGATRSEASM